MVLLRVNIAPTICFLQSLDVQCILKNILQASTVRSAVYVACVGPVIRLHVAHDPPMMAIFTHGKAAGLWLDSVLAHSNDFHCLVVLSRATGLNVTVCDITALLPPEAF